MSGPDLFTLPHKALRAYFGSMATQVGSLDVTGVDEAAELARLVHDGVETVRAHGGHEDDFVVPLLHRYRPDLERRLLVEHAELGRLLDDLLEHVAAFERTPSQSAQLALYRHVRRVEASNLAHLDMEETILMPALWQLAPPEELLETFTSFKAAHPEAVELYRRAPDALTAAERTIVLA